MNFMSNSYEAYNSEGIFAKGLFFSEGTQAQLSRHLKTWKHINIVIQMMVSWKSFSQ